MIKQNKRKQLPSASVQKMQIKKHAINYRNRKTAMLHNQLVAPTRPELTIYAAFEKLLKTGRRVIDATVYFKGLRVELFEHYIKSSARPDFVPKTRLTKGMTVGNFNLLISDCGKSSISNGVMKFNKLADKEFKDEKRTIESWIGYVPKTNLHNNATFRTVLETKPKAFFVLVEKEHVRIDEKHTQHVSTRIVISRSIVWLKTIVDKNEASEKRFAEMLPKDLAPHIFPTKSKLKIVKFKRTIKKFE
jgi:hypothetical protein